MTTILLVGFLAAHGLIHLAIWMPQIDPQASTQPPFRPDRSLVLTALGVPQVFVRRLSRVLAAGAAVAFLLTAVGVALDLAWVIPAAAAAAILGVAVKVLYFHPWLTVGVLLDVGVLTATLSDWPVPLS